MTSEISGFAIRGYYNTREPIDWFYMPGQIDVTIEDGTILDMYWNCIFSVVVINAGGAPATHTIRIVRTMDGQAFGDPYTQQISLNPGETYTWELQQWVDFRRLSYYKVAITGDWEANNYSEGVARL